MSGEVLKTSNKDITDKENIPLSQQKPVSSSLTRILDKPNKSRPALIVKENVKKSHFHQKTEKLRSKGNDSSVQKEKKWKIYDETAGLLKKFKSTSTQTDDKELVCSEQPTERYWELLAEERRKALSSALEENKELAEELKKKDSLIENLKIEIEHLEEVASHTDYLTSVIEELMKANELGENQSSLNVPANTPNVSNEEESNVDSSLNVFDRNEPFKGNFDLSDGSCSHDSDKENKPPANCC